MGERDGARLHAVVPVAGGVAPGLLDVVGVLVGVVACDVVSFVRQIFSG